ncbi:hypothetical protein [Oligoflexus tunisiensis]|uniref:hypothetical protein n=1 Tax=Oligoflexus tunisiensis TaxID=708132 RepID=UPI00114CFB18|nr:hypothetical protein [Oligoflexus tunisiensis]
MRFKKLILISVLGLLGLFVVTVTGIGYAVYQTAGFAKETLSTWEVPTDLDDKVVLPNRGWIEDFVISVSSLWLQQSLAEQDTVQLKNGLSCFDAIGGPSPLELVNYVKTRVEDARITEELETLTASLQESDSTERGPAACAVWMLNG